MASRSGWAPRSGRNGWPGSPACSSKSGARARGAPRSICASRSGRPEEGRPGIARKGLKEYVVGLDVGTTKICAVIAEPNASGGIDVVGVGTAPSRGLRKGVVVNIDATVEAIRQAVGEAEQMAGVEVAGVYAGVAGGHIRGVNSRGVVAVGNKDREVSVVDVQRAIDAARAINLPQD